MEGESIVIAWVSEYFFLTRDIAGQRAIPVKERLLIHATVQLGKDVPAPSLLFVRLVQDHIPAVVIGGHLPC